MQELLRRGHARLKALAGEGEQVAAGQVDEPRRLSPHPEVFPGSAFDAGQIAEDPAGGADAEEPFASLEGQQLVTDPVRLDAVALAEDNNSESSGNTAPISSANRLSVFGRDTLPRPADWQAASGSPCWTRSPWSSCALVGFVNR